MTDDLLQEMIDPQTAGADKPRRRRLTATVLILALAVIGITSLTTGAIFTDRETTNGDLLTGTVDLTAGDLTVTLPTEGLAPGDKVDTSFDVTNSGSLALRYAVLYSADGIAGTHPAPDVNDPDNGTMGTGDLGDVLSLSVIPLGTASTCATATPPSGANNGTVATLDTGGTFLPLLGSNVQGPQVNDRELAATSHETLCLHMEMDIDADNSYQNTGIALTLRFDAEQVVNNP